MKAKIKLMGKNKASVIPPNAPGNADAPANDDAPAPGNIILNDPHLEGNAIPNTAEGNAPPEAAPRSEGNAIPNAPDPEAIREPLEPVRKTTKLSSLRMLNSGYLKIRLSTWLF